MTNRPGVPMTGQDVAQLAQQAATIATTAVAAVGARALDQVEDEIASVAASGVAQLGRSVLRLLLGRRSPTAPKIADALRDVATDPSDEDAQGALRLHIKKALQSDSELRDELVTLLGRSG